MKRRLPRGIDIGWVDSGPSHRGRAPRPAKETFHRWMSREKRRTHKRERREGKAVTRES